MDDSGKEKKPCSFFKRSGRRAAVRKRKHSSSDEGKPLVYGWRFPETLAFSPSTRSAVTLKSEKGPSILWHFGPPCPILLQTTVMMSQQWWGERGRKEEEHSSKRQTHRRQTKPKVKHMRWLQEEERNNDCVYTSFTSLISTPPIYNLSSVKRKRENTCIRAAICKVLVARQHTNNLCRNNSHLDILQMEQHQPEGWLCPGHVGCNS